MGLLRIRLVLHIPRLRDVRELARLAIDEGKAIFGRDGDLVLVGRPGIVDVGRHPTIQLRAAPLIISWRFQLPALKGRGDTPDRRRRVQRLQRVWALCQVQSVELLVPDVDEAELVLGCVIEGTFQEGAGDVEVGLYMG